MIEHKPFFAASGNCRALPLAEIPRLSFADFAAAIEGEVAAGRRVASLFGAAPESSNGEDATRLFVVIANDEEDRLALAQTLVEGPSFPSMTPACPQVQLFEREIAEDFGLRPEGHPWFKPVRYVHSRTGRDAWGRSQAEAILPAVGDFYRVEGEEVHEVAVGPVHAGVIEPGHFRFQCHGEKVFHLEIALGYQHRGIERALEGGPNRRSLHYAETMAGDTTIGHATTYCHVVEALGKSTRTVHSSMVRGIALELERMANHVGDLGAISGDVGYLPTASFCGRLRGDFLNMTALLCGNRFGRGLLRPGGIGFDLEPSRAVELLARVEKAEKEVAQAVKLLWDDQSVMARLEDTGPLSKETAALLGVVGPAARASGLARDVRYNHPSGIYRFAHIPVSTCDTGDVFARAYVRWLEIQQSITFIKEELRSLPPPQAFPPVGPLAPESLAVSLNEGWRGEICHVALTDAQGRFSRYKVVDPSFHNWYALAYAMRDQEISDFPLCNKSFNLSYCGHDL
jgi:Ni,Fe-hydrogenase III large subunit